VNLRLCVFVAAFDGRSANANKKFSEAPAERHNTHELSQVVRFEPVLPDRSACQEDPLEELGTEMLRAHLWSDSSVSNLSKIELGSTGQRRVSN